MKEHGVILYDEAVQDHARKVKDEAVRAKKQLREDLLKVYEIGNSVPVYKAPPIPSIDEIIPKAA
jgi:hypothetical protein